MPHNEVYRLPQNEVFRVALPQNEVYRIVLSQKEVNRYVLPQNKVLIIVNCPIKLKLLGVIC